MKRLVIGILAHVDAGKTTLSEAILYQSGNLRIMGRVDKGNSFFDSYELERERGITIFSKQVVFRLGEMQVTLLDTPGHVDFSAEMERTLQVLDYAILVISASDGIQGHTQTLWRLLAKYNIPFFLFINKMDQNGADRETVLMQLGEKLSNGCIDFSAERNSEFYESIAIREEKALENFLRDGELLEDEITELIAKRMVYPCYFGAALHLNGVEKLLTGLMKYTKTAQYGEKFGARVFKVTRDEQGNRLTHMKITGGSLQVKNIIEGTKEKINQIRMYSGDKYSTEQEAFCGDICAVTGLENIKAGEGFGTNNGNWQPILEPVLHYRMLLPPACDAAAFLPKLKQLEEEEPLLHIRWEEVKKEIQVQLMGEIQMEILKNLISQRFSISVDFDEGSIVYKETIAEGVIGVGHFEPLRHYAEVQLLLEPLERGAGVLFALDCSEDELAKNWQRLILTHLEEKEHKGVLTGSEITDIKITLIAGAAHKKHTEGGDFRQATYRAVRQGLKRAETILLEPYYEFRMEVPEELLGRAMTDIDRMSGTFESPVIENANAVLVGKIPVSAMAGYQKEMIAYTKGRGKVFCNFCGYEECHNTDEIVERIAYDSERDMENPTSSVFCAHGSGFIVPWNEAPAYMHLKNKYADSIAEEKETGIIIREVQDEFIGEDEIERIMSRTFYANKRDKSVLQEEIRRRRAESTVIYSMPKKAQKILEEYVLVDGYNVIYAWQDLKELAAVNMDGARGKLIDILCNYQGAKQCRVVVVFDAYRVKGRITESFSHYNIKVVYTKEGQTADRYIEQFAYDNSKKYHITVVTSDYLEQMIAGGVGCHILSTREFKEEIKREIALLYQSDKHMI